LNQLSEVLGVVDIRKRLRWNRKAQKVAKRFPSLLDVEDQELILRHCSGVNVINLCVPDNATS